MKIYHNPRCSKSRCALDWLQKSNFQYDIVDYIKNPISVIELTHILKELNMRPLELMRKNELEFKELIQGKNLSDEEIVQFMVRFPKLIERPIVVWDSHAIVARPLEKLTELFNV